jgi:chromate transporter
VTDPTTPSAGRAGAAEEAVVLERPRSSGQLFVAFTALALQGFGGVLAVAQHGLCEQRRWLSKQDFLEILSIGQLLPGPNICNVALMVGYRFFGLAGALCALAGLMTVPLVIVLTLATLYGHASSIPEVSRALRGMAVVSGGLIAGTALRLMAGLRTNPMGAPLCAGLGLATFVAVGLMRWPLVWTLLGVGALAMALAAWRIGRAGGEAPAGRAAPPPGGRP